MVKYSLTYGWWNDQLMVDRWVMAGEFLTNKWLMLSKWLMNGCTSVQCNGFMVVGMRLLTTYHRQVLKYMCLWSVKMRWICWDGEVGQQKRALRWTFQQLDQQHPARDVHVWDLESKWSSGLFWIPKWVQLRIPRGELVIASSHWLFPSCLWQTVERVIIS